MCCRMPELYYRRKAIKYAFQPIVDVKTGEIMAYEALMCPQSQQLSTPTDVMRMASAQSKLFEIECLTSILTMEAYNRQRDEFLDDYGTGYNTESTLLYIAPKYVKIDMSILQGVR